MNTRTGEIIDGKELEELKQKMDELGEEGIEELKAEMKNFVEIQNADMTRKQKRLKQVSKHDNRSKLGKKFLGFRNQRR